MAHGKKVFVGLSGGVDSSVTAKRLLELGYDVTGVFIKTWQPDFITCNWEKERLDAMRVAAHLGIPFLTCDAEEAYKRDVAEYMIAEYKAGRTPNPDVMCNRFVKFGAFLSYAREHGVDYVATGHYAQIIERDGIFHLHRGADQNKDQSYFLWTLTQEQLANIIFPVGDTAKLDIRKEAERAYLPTFAKSDSQGICFLGPVDMKEFLSHYINTEPGAVTDETGKRIGTHDGAILYTIGQRHGLTIDTATAESTPHFVIAKDIETNTITVSTSAPHLTGNRIHLSALNLIPNMRPEECEAQFRYRQKPFQVHIEYGANGHATLTVLDAGVETPSVGQSCVLYRGNECLGGGIIERIS